MKRYLSYFLSGSLWIGGRYVGIASFRLFQTIFLARILNKEFYGEYHFIFATIYLFGIFSLPEMGLAISQSIAKGFSSSFIEGTKAKVKGSLLGSIAMLGMSAWFYPNPLWIIFFFLTFLFPLYHGLRSIIAYYYGKENFRKGTLYNLFIEAVSSVTAVSVAAFTHSLILVVVVTLTLVSLIQLTLSLRAKNEINPHPKDSSVVRYGTHLSLMSIFIYLTPYFDRFLIGTTISFEALAIYAVALSSYNLLFDLGRYFTFLLLPKFSHAEPHHFPLIRKMFWIISSIIILFIIGWILAIPWIIPIVFSKEYTSSIPLAQIALISLFFSFPSVILLAFFQAQKKIKFLYSYNFGYGILNLLLLTIMLPLRGLEGAIESKIISAGAGFIYLLGIFLYQTRRRVFALQNE